MTGVDDFAEAVPDLFSELLAALREGRDATVPLAQVCRAVVERMPVDGAAVALMVDGTHRTLVHASDPVIEHLDAVQFSLGEGPSFEAFETGRPVLVPDLAQRLPVSWPVFATEAGIAGMCGIFAFPLRQGAAMLGAVDTYRRVPGWLSDEELATVLRGTDVVSSALLAVATAGGTGEEGDDVVGGLVRGRAAVHQATGIVIAEFGIPADQALAWLRAYAYSEGRLLDEVARDLVDRRLHPREIQA
ncbi:GAF and ANTAR domain-containing protein [Amycolatopsis circi]|uniref:GAF and ANTAR domain-containing protein n=1 Tax=Amycolatopsis circi TaxID=871959 RepID=UPI000E27EA36|nr:GAF and ANTAR domain-containing protein [Amycolatopsis circi]